MAHLHFRRTLYKGGGTQASARIDYITGRTEADASTATRQLAYITRVEREDLVYESSRNLPAWAEGNPHVYFQAAERGEAKKEIAWTAFEEWKLTLPQELTRAQNFVLAECLIDVIAGKDLPCTYAFHEPQTLDGTHQQPHLHLLISARMNDEHIRTPEQHFKRWNKEHPERGGAQKNPAFWHKGAIKAHRVLISDVVNLHLERAGCEDRLHPDRLADRDLTRTPEPKLLPSESRAYREHGIVTPTMEKVLTIRAQRKDTQQAEQANARAYWQERKTVLGLTEGMDGAAQLAAVCTARALVRDHAPTKAVVLGAVGVEGDDRTLGDLAREAAEDVYTGEQTTAWLSLEHALQALTQQLNALSTDAGTSGEVRIRLWEKEQGLSF